jgi:hypothetical protein
VVGLGRGLIDCFFPRMKEDFSNILTILESVQKVRYNGLQGDEDEKKNR